MTKKVAIIMGSDSDLSVMMEAADKLKQFDIPYEVHIISAHRTPAAAEQFASAAIDNGFGVIIAGAGKAAHLGGVLAAYTTLPVIGVPIKTSMMGGLDSLLSMVQMPSWPRRCWPSATRKSTPSWSPTRTICGRPSWKRTPSSSGSWGNDPLPDWIPTTT